MVRKQTRDTLILSGAIFALFFGAGNLIFPPALGAVLGDHWALGAFGFCLTTILLSFLSMVAVARSGSGFKDMTRNIHKPVQILLGVVMMLAIGPLLAIPRTGATTLEMGIQPIFSGIFEVNDWLVTGLYFCGVLFFSFSRTGILDNIGKILTPLLVVTLLTIIIQAIVNPLGEPISHEFTRSFSHSFVEGYQTLDPIGGIVFTIAILTALTDKGYNDKQVRIKMVTRSSALACSGLVIIYVGLMYLGASGQSEVSEGLGRTAYFVALIEKLLGGKGVYILGMAVTVACFTTAVGLSSTTGIYFERITDGKISYKLTVGLVVLTSFLLANLGVDKIVEFSAPILVLIYPSIIVLIFLNLGGNILNQKRTHQMPFYTAMAFGVIGLLPSLGIEITILNNIVELIPLSSYGFSWVIPSLLAGVLAYVYEYFSDSSSVKNASV